MMDTEVNAVCGPYDTSAERRRNGKVKISTDWPHNDQEPIFSLVMSTKEKQCLVMFVLGCRATIISGLVRHKETQGSRSIGDGCCCILGAVAHHPKELGIGQGLERQVGSRLVGVEQTVLGNQEQVRLRAGHQLGQQWLFGAPHLVFWRCLPPSCVPSTPFGFP